MGVKKRHVSVVLVPSEQNVAQMPRAGGAGSLSPLRGSAFLTRRHMHGLPELPQPPTYPQRARDHVSAPLLPCPSPRQYTGAR